MTKSGWARKVVWPSLFAGFLASGVAVAAQQINECTATGVALPNPQGLVMEATGDVKAKVGNGATCPVARGQGIVNDTVITTGAKGSVILRFADGQGISLQENSSFHIQNYVYDQNNISKSSAAFRLIQGGLRAATGLIGQKNKDGFRLTAGAASIGIHGTAFALAITPSGVVVGTVTEGAITIGGQTFGVGATFTASIQAGVLVITPGLPAGVTTVSTAAGIGATGPITIPATVAAAGTSAVSTAASAAAAAAGAGFGAAAIGVAAAIGAAAAAAGAAPVAVVAAAESGTTGTGTTGTTGTIGTTGTQ